ncbi:MAG TPA: hypothetical protein VG013_36090 [Gemmataceae bacterium]|nr:hypothetical protein [Gemmataceae bacterium]
MRTAQTMRATATRLRLIVALLAVGAAAAAVALLAHHALAEKPPPARRNGQHQPQGQPVRPEETANHKLDRTDRYGDPLPAGAIARMGTIRLRPGSALAFSPDGKFLASGGPGGDSSLRLWEVATGKQVREFGAHQEILTVAFSHDGKIVASGGDDDSVTLGIIRLWDTATGKQLRQVKGEWGEFHSIAFSSDGKILASGGWDLRNPTVRCVRLWDAATGQELRKLKGAARGANLRIEALALSPNDRTLATVGAGVRLWDVATGEELRRLQGHKGRVFCVAYAPDGKTLATGSEDTTVRLWEAATGKALGSFRAGDWVSSVAFSPDGKVLASGSSQSVRLWDVANRKELRRFGQSGGATSVAFSPDGKTLVSGDLTMIRLWDPATGKALRPLGGHSSAVGCVAFSPDGKMLTSASWDNTIRLWEAATGRELGRLEGLSHGATSLAFAADGKTLISGSGEAIRFWDLAARRELRQFAPPEVSGRVMALSPDGKVLASGSADGAIRLLDVTTGHELRRLQKSYPRNPLGPNGVQSLAFSPAGRTLAAAVSLTLQLWDLGGEKPSVRTPFKGRNYSADVLAYTPDGKTLAFADYEAIHLLDVATGKTWRLFHGDWKAFLPTSLAFAPDGKTLAAGSRDHTIGLWETATGKARCRLQGHRDLVWSVAFSPDGKHLASRSGDTTALIWDLAGRLEEERPAAPLSREELASLWADLAGADAPAAYRAMWALVAAPRQAVPFLEKHLRPVSHVDSRRLGELVRDLDSDRFAVRQKAQEELDRLGKPAEAALRKVLAGQSSLELRRRVQQLLKQLEWPVASPERLREIRAVEALEQIGTPGVRRVLAKLAHGAPAAPLTREAQAAIERLARQPTASR